MKRHSFTLNFLAGTIGNACEHYDKCLFGFLAPFLAPLFFKHHSPLTALILIYGMMPLSLLSRPIGALVFGKIGDRQGRKAALFWTLIGMAGTTCLIGFLPTYDSVGILAPISLAFLRLVQNFFAAGEVTGGSLLILESCDPSHKSFFSSLYDCSSVLGILIASFMVMVLSQLGLVETYWRLLYWAGALTALIGIGIRLFIQDPPKTDKLEKVPTLALLWRYRRPFVAITLVTGFSYVIYESATSLMNSYLPLISGLTKGDLIKLNTWVLLLDLCLLPFFGWLAMKVTKKYVMLFFISITLLFALPFFGSLPGATLKEVTMIRIAFVILGVGFSASLHAWSQDLAPKEHRYTLIALAVALGGHFIGGGTTTFSLWIYKKTGSPLSLSFYLIASAALAGTAILLASPSREKEGRTSSTKSAVSIAPKMR